MLNGAWESGQLVLAKAAYHVWYRRRLHEQAMQCAEQHALCDHCYISVSRHA